MGLKHLLLWMLAVLLVELSIRVASKPGAEIPLREAVKRNIQKICGPDFRRAIVHVCGASRWKRMSLQGKGNPSVSGLVQTNGNEGIENVKDYYTQPSVQLQGDQSHHQKMFSDKAYKKHIFTSAGDVGQNADPIRTANAIGSGFPQVKYFIRKRQDASELEIRCCNEGCTFEEIVQAFC